MLEARMATNDLDRLATLVEQRRDSLLSSWRRQVRKLPAARHLDVPTLNDHIPGLLDELVAALRSSSEQTIPEDLAEGSAPAHGLQRLQDAFDIEEVVAEYNILRGCIHDLAEAEGVNLQGKPFHAVNRVFSQAIGLALQAYTTERALELQRRREEYLSFVAHDLRNPIFAISLAGRVLELRTKDRDLDSETNRMLKALRRNVQHLEALVDKVLQENANLETEGGVKLGRREIDLWPVVEALVLDLQQVAGTSSTKLLNEVPDDLVAYVDAGLLRRIFENLIANAIRYTPNGVVTIGARGFGAGGAVECTVADDGAGIPDELVARVFERGVTDPEAEGGAGLGLAIVKTFVEAHGGSVTVESKLGVGTTFRFSLPGRGG
jgi:signal transduction histidine kinase